MPEKAPPAPQDLAAEEHVLGASLLSPSALGVCTELVTPVDFYRQSHGALFDVMLAMHGRGDPVDQITVVDELAKLGKTEAVGGEARVYELAGIVPATSNAAHYARIVHEMATLRGLIRAGSDIARLGYERPGEIGDLVERAEGMVFELSQARSRRHEFVTASQMMTETVQRLQELAAAGKAVIGVPTGYTEIDRMTSGLHPGNLIVIAARPSIGKSAMVLGMLAHSTLRIDPPTPVALFTLEMSRWEVSQRLLSSEAAVDSQHIQTPMRLDGDDWERVLNASGRIANAPMFVEESAGITVTELRSKARRLKTKHPDLGMVAVDYIQLMGSGGRFESRQQEVSQISRALKVLAQELDVPVVALSQLSRDVEKRHDKRPILSDLRESGSIEQDADVVLMLYRDEYYYPDETDSAGIAEVNIAKHRNGPTGMRKLAFISKYAKFGNLAQEGGR